MKNNSKNTNLKGVVVGDAAVGKTCMLMTYLEGKFPEEYVPTVFDNYHKILRASDGKQYKFSIWDTAGAEELDRMRALFYPKGSVFLVCFSVVSPIAFASVTERWKDELMVHAEGKPFLLVGTKTDLREDAHTIEKLQKQHLTAITKQQGEDLAVEIGAEGYFECSARKQEGLNEIFQKAVDVAARYTNPESFSSSSSSPSSSNNETQNTKSEEKSQEGKKKTTPTKKETTPKEETTSKKGCVIM